MKRPLKYNSTVYITVINTNKYLRFVIYYIKFKTSNLILRIKSPQNIKLLKKN